MMAAPDTGQWELQGLSEALADRENDVLTRQVILELPTGVPKWDDLAVFKACDVDGSGCLSETELTFALRAFGLFPTEEQVKAGVPMEDSAGVDLAGFRAARERCAEPESPCRRGAPAVPYAWRSLALWQLIALRRAFVDDGWLRARCQGECGQCSGRGDQRHEDNLYALDQFVVRPATDPAQFAELPAEKRALAGLPDPIRKTSVAELTSPEGRESDYFVSHFWGHPYTKTVAALKSYAESACRSSGSEPEDASFWICLFALNQHKAADEVGASPEDGPFNAALAWAGGAVMVLDAEVRPFSRLWCLFEVHQLKQLGRPLDLVCDDGPLTSAPQAVLRSVGDAVAQVRAEGASASCEADQVAITARIMDSTCRHLHRATADAHRAWLRSGRVGPPPIPAGFFRNGGPTFSEFDNQVTGLLAGPMLRTTLAEPCADRDACVAEALRWLGLGAEPRAEDLDRLEQLGVDLTSAEVEIRNPRGVREVPLLAAQSFFGHLAASMALLDRGAPPGAADFMGRTALHRAAAAGHAAVAALLLERGAPIDATDSEGAVPLHLAALSGHSSVVAVLLDQRAAVASADWRGRRPLDLAARGGHGGIAALLLDFRADANAVDDGGWAPLHCAAAGGHRAVAMALLAGGADASAVEDGGRTPLELAVEKGHQPVAELLSASPNTGGGGARGLKGLSTPCAAAVTDTLVPTPELV